MAARDKAAVVEFASSGELAEELAADVAARLAAAVATGNRATLAVSGGATPAPFFDALSRRQLDWTKVIVTLVDERFVPPQHPRSNEKLVRDRLLVNEARLARFIALYSAVDSVEVAARQAEPGVALMAQPLDVVVLGMGADGHTASLFPDAVNLPALLDPAQRRLVMPVHARSAGEPRLTLPLAVICKARAILLHIEGTEKRRVFEHAEEEGLPIAAVLDAAQSPVTTYWAP